MITTIDPKKASLEELVSTIIGVETAKAAEALATYGVAGRETLSLATSDWRDLVHAGLTKSKAIRLAAAVELGLRLTRENARRWMEDFCDPSSVAHYFMTRYKYSNQEHLAVAYLNRKNKLVGVQEISIGDSWSAQVDDRAIFRWAMRYNAASIIIVHNHPSGNPDPSPEDDDMTRSLYRKGEIMDVGLLDSIVVGDGSYYSYEETGRLGRVVR